MEGGEGGSCVMCAGFRRCRYVPTPEAIMKVQLDIVFVNAHAQSRLFSII